MASPLREYTSVLIDKSAPAGCGGACRTIGFRVSCELAAWVHSGRTVVAAVMMKPAAE
jgi:hypothetical protein